MYDFSFFLVCKLYKSGVKVLNLIWDSVDTEGLIVAYFERLI